MIQSAGPTHESLLIALLALGVPNLVIAIFFVFQHKLMWRDYVKRKHLNGDREDT